MLDAGLPAAGPRLPALRVRGACADGSGCVFAALWRAVSGSGGCGSHRGESDIDGTPLLEAASPTSSDWDGVSGPYLRDAVSAVDMTDSSSRGVSISVVDSATLTPASLPLASIGSSSRGALQLRGWECPA